MTPQEAKAELQRQAERLGYVGDEGLGLLRIFATIDAYIAGEYPGEPWENGTHGSRGGSIVGYIRELQQRKPERYYKKKQRRDR